MPSRFFLLALVVLSLSAPAAAQMIDGTSYACRPLVEALRDLQARGLPVVFSSNLVGDGLQVREVPTANAPRQLLKELLAPHGLRAQQGVGGRLLVVQSFSGTATVASSVPPWSVPRVDGSSRPDAEGDSVWPTWVEEDTSSALTVIEITARDVANRAPIVVTADSRYLLLRLAPSTDITHGANLAFDLKALIVEARSRVENLKVALEATTATIERLLEHDLAPYLDAYLGDQVTKTPSSDPTARLWWRPPPNGQALHSLLQGAALGAELVLFDQPLDPRHRAFLGRIQATPSVDLEHQPTVDGLAPDQVRFLYGLETGIYYLAVYAEPGRKRTLSFSLGTRVEARRLYPADAPVPAARIGDRIELELAGDHPFHLIELRPENPHQVENGVLRVEGQAFVDPYEIVVRNQVFQEREARKVRSLDVMERRDTVSQTHAARRYTWIHRVIERPGRLTEFHHLGVERNGVPFPERRLRIGRDFRAEAQVELDPLEIELDRTYRYKYLGQETVDGHSTWKIGFEPLQEGAYLTGTVWIDRDTHAHRKIQTAHAGLSGSVISRDMTRFYDWVPDNGQCFWNWSRSEGLSVIESPTSRVALAIDAERYGFEYNRDDIEHEVRKAHASDVPIHVATPPDGHRWLVKDEPKRKRRRRLGRLFHRRSPEREATVALAKNQQPAPIEADRIPDGAQNTYVPGGVQARHHAPVLDHLGAPNTSISAGDESFGGRVLADRGAFTSASDVYLISRDNCSNTISCNGVGIDYRRTDLFKNRSELYTSLFDIQGFASLTYPRVGGSRWVMTTSLRHDLSYWDNSILQPGTGALAGFQQRRTGITIAFARPIDKTLRVRGSFGLSHLGLRPDPENQFPDFSLPDSIMEQRSAFQLDFQRRKIYSRASLDLRWRGAQDAWGIDGSEPLADSPSRFSLVTGYSTSLAKDRSLGSRFVFQKGWSLDHFSDFFSGFDGVRAPGFQPQRYETALGASVSLSCRLTPRLPLTLRLEGAMLRSQRYPNDDADQLGFEVETFLNAWFKTDIFLRLGYGLYSSIPDQDGKLRSRIVISRRF